MLTRSTLGAQDDAQPKVARARQFGLNRAQPNTSMYPQQSQRTALDFNSLLITIEERADAALLDAARALLDGLTLEETVDSLGTLLDWQLVPEGAAATPIERNLHALGETRGVVVVLSLRVAEALKRLVGGDELVSQILDR